MTAGSLRTVIAGGEGPQTEFKRGMPSDPGREICAFANAAGGVILVGVTDEGEVVGVGRHDRLQAEIQSIARSADPPIRVQVESVDSVLVVQVPPQSAKPYSFGGRFFLREGASSQQMSRDEVRDFFFAEGRIRFDETPCPTFSFDEDLDEETWTKFRRRAKVPADAEPETALRNLGLIGADGVVTHAAAFLLARDIRRFQSSAGLSCALFMGRRKARILDRRDFHSDVYAVVDEAVAWVLSKINIEYIIRGRTRREERPELPPGAIREAVVNAVAHRDYRSAASVHLYLFQDRLEIVSPGGLPAGMTAAELGTRSVPRNRLLFRLLHRRDAVEDIGSGIQRIRELCSAHGVEEPRIETSKDWVSVIFRRPAPDSGRSGVAESAESAASGSEEPESGPREPESRSKEPEWGHGIPVHRQESTVRESDFRPIEPESPGEPESPRETDAGEPESRAEPSPERSARLSERVLAVLRNGPLAKSGIAAALGQEAVSGPLNRAIRNLLAAGAIERTVPDRPNSRLQRYRRTGDGERRPRSRAAEHPCLNPAPRRPSAPQ